ncbi:hypothetical protein ABZS95_10240 [Streptomyces sp. NPDC005479]|uniref:hypothetical protein n=1 Tax=Streptomyces sp. NPDC005479 TaxID=3154879 RepID=UPI0033A50CA6
MTGTPPRTDVTVSQVHAFLLEHFSEDVLLRYQRAVGEVAVDEAVREMYEGDPATSPAFSEGVAWACDYVSGGGEAGPFPFQLVGVTDRTHQGPLALGEPSRSEH